MREGWTSQKLEESCNKLNIPNNTTIALVEEWNKNKIQMISSLLSKTITANKLIEFDENGNRIVYKQKNVLLQKWNNIIINYNGGILDIFLNGELVKSNIEVVPYYTLDSLSVGEDNGINGSLCNLIYFNKPLTSYNIYYLYNAVKNKTPPVMIDNNLTIVKENVAAAQTSASGII